MGVIHHRIYFVWCEMGRTELLRELGASYAELERQGIFLAVHEARMSYRASARYDDLIRVRTTLQRLRSRGVTFGYVVENAETSEVLARGATEHVCLSAGSTPRKLPGAIYELLERALEGASEEGTKHGP